jgi:hypothetical protein
LEIGGPVKEMASRFRPDRGPALSSVQLELQNCDEWLGQLAVALPARRSWFRSGFSSGRTVVSARGSFPAGSVFVKAITSMAGGHAFRP